MSGHLYKDNTTMIFFLKHITENKTVLFFLHFHIYIQTDSVYIIRENCPIFLRKILECMNKNTENNKPIKGNLRSFNNN